MTNTIAQPKCEFIVNYILDNFHEPIDNNIVWNKILLAYINDNPGKTTRELKKGLEVTDMPRTARLFRLAQRRLLASGKIIKLLNDDLKYIFYLNPEIK